MVSVAFKAPAGSLSQRPSVYFRFMKSLLKSLRLYCCQEAVFLRLRICALPHLLVPISSATSMSISIVTSHNQLVMMDFHFKPNVNARSSTKDLPLSSGSAAKVSILENSLPYISAGAQLGESSPRLQPVIYSGPISFSHLPGSAACNCYWRCWFRD